MQNDLISKSELLMSLNDWIDENTDIKTILRWIEEYEIAYDIEKVVSKLEEIKKKNDEISKKLTFIPYIRKFEYASELCSKIINIVLNGGKE